MLSFGLFARQETLRTLGPANNSRRREAFLMATGTVKWFNDGKGYGFVEPDDGGSDLFVHFSAIQASGRRTLYEGDKVSFDVEDDPRGKGKRAANVVVQQSL